MDSENTSTKVFVTGFFDLLNSGQVSFLKEAARYGDLYVGVGSDNTFRELKGRQPVCSEQERLYMVKAVRYVKDAFINSGSGILDFLTELDSLQPDIFVVNYDGGNELKRKLCEERGIKYKSIGAGGAVSAAKPQYGAGEEYCEADTFKASLPDRHRGYVDRPAVCLGARGGLGDHGFDRADV